MCTCRGFDQQMASKIGDYMEEHGVNFIKECLPISLEKVEPNKIKVSSFVYIFFLSWKRYRYLQIRLSHKMI
jgi:hypothetical protein